MSDERDAAVCAICFVTGYVAPWACLIAGGLLGLTTGDPYWQKTAAWLTALGVGMLALSYFWARLVNTLDARRRP